MRKIKIKLKRKEVDTESIIEEALSRVPPIDFPPPPEPFAIPPLEDHEGALEPDDSVVLYDKSKDEHHEVTLKQLMNWLGTSTPLGRVQTPKRVHTPMRDRFSHLTDGSTKTFTLSKQPNDINTITVHSSDYPMILDPGVDFTLAGKTLTLTDAVDAPTTGSTLIVTYYY